MGRWVGLLRGRFAEHRSVHRHGFRGRVHWQWRAESTTGRLWTSRHRPCRGRTVVGDGMGRDWAFRCSRRSHRCLPHRHGRHRRPCRGQLHRRARADLILLERAVGQWSQWTQSAVWIDVVEDDVVPVTSQLARLYLPVCRTERPTERWVEHHHAAGRPSAQGPGPWVLDGVLPAFVGCSSVQGVKCSK